MNIAATAQPQHPPRIVRPWNGPRGLSPLTPPDRDRDFADAGWAGLDEQSERLARPPAVKPAPTRPTPVQDLDDALAAANAADMALLRMVGCAAFATLVLALVSSLQ
jgi:hypothetical protein